MAITWKTVTAPNFTGANYLTKNAMDTVSGAIATGLDIARGIDEGRKQSKTNQRLAQMENTTLDNFDKVVKPLLQEAADEGADVPGLVAAAAQRRAALQQRDEYQYEQGTRAQKDALERRRTEAAIRNMDQQYATRGVSKDQQQIMADNIATACDGDVDCMRRESTNAGLPINLAIQSRELQLNAGGKLSPGQLAQKSKSGGGFQYDIAPKNLQSDFWDLFDTDRAAQKGYNDLNKKLYEGGVKEQAAREAIISQGFNRWNNFDATRVDPQAAIDKYIYDKNKEIPNPQ